VRHHVLQHLDDAEDQYLDNADDDCSGDNGLVGPASLHGHTGQANVGLGPYLPLWPFATSGEVQAWEQSNASGGHQPWHLDAGLTAQAFVTGYLGFTEIDTVISTTVDAGGAHVAIGFVTTGTSTATAAVVHMVRWGTGAGAPWEGVGTDDTTLALTTPPYGSTAGNAYLRVGAAGG